MNVVKYGYVFANDGNCFVLHRFIDELRVFDKNEIIVKNVHDRITLVVKGIQVRNALRHRRARAQTIGGVCLKHAKTNVGAQLVGQLERNWQADNFEFFHVVDENSHRPVAHRQNKLFGVILVACLYMIRGWTFLFDLPVRFLYESVEMAIRMFVFEMLILCNMFCKHCGSIGFILTMI